MVWASSMLQATPAALPFCTAKRLEIAPFWTHIPFACEQASERGPEGPETRLGAHGADLLKVSVHPQHVWAKGVKEAGVLVAVRSILLRDRRIQPRLHA